MIQAVLRYLGLDEESKRVRSEAQQNLEKAGSQLTQLQLRFEETRKISTTGRRALRKTLSESDFGKRRAAGG